MFVYVCDRSREKASLKNCSHFSASSYHCAGPWGEKEKSIFEFRAACIGTFHVMIYVRGNNSQLYPHLKKKLILSTLVCEHYTILHFYSFSKYIIKLKYLEICWDLLLEVGTLAAGWLLGDRQLVIISWLLEKTSFKSRVKKQKNSFTQFSLVIQIGHTCFYLKVIQVFISVYFYFILTII